ncbi:uncharacterized protein LOC8062422 isoform X2 [Sorghum bicolor]|nr:uncharacterized protein LOC8062422 isoform X2 [Sorghum bicolor]|eukprot:XP_021320525.1 uncharacterized protein LOC8062422 isoform X2 [Sorghum bicolor]
MHDLSDIYFIGGFGTVAWIDVKEYETVQPDKTAVDGGDLQSLKVTNHTRSVIPCLYGIMIATGVECYISLNHFERSEGEVDAAALISVDSEGIDIRVRQGAQFNIQRLAFDVPQKVETLEESQESTPQDNNERQAANNVRKVAEAGLYAFF